MKGSKDLRISENKEEDTLSLSDLIPIHDDDDIDSEECEKYYDSKSSITTNSSDDHEDVFEFMSNYKNNVLLLQENILFCGKLIPNKNKNNNNNPILSSMPKKRSFSLSRKSKLLGYNPTHQEMELKDLKNRLNRKVVGDGISDCKNYGKVNGKGKGILWSLIKTLSCTSGGASYHAQSAVKASIGCISLV